MINTIAFLKSIYNLWHIDSLFCDSCALNEYFITFRNTYYKDVFFHAQNICWLFLFLELHDCFFKRSKKGQIKKAEDSYSLTILWIAIPASMTCAFFFANRQQWNTNDRAIALGGLVVFIIGMAIRWTAIWQLGKAFTVDVSISKDQVLKTNGLYHYIRHPSYSGLLLILCGIAMTMDNLFSFLIILVINVAALNYRITIEERTLAEEFGSEFEIYRRRTKKLLPGIY